MKHKITSRDLSRKLSVVLFRGIGDDVDIEMTFINKYTIVIFLNKSYSYLGVDRLLLEVVYFYARVPIIYIEYFH